VEQSSGNVDTQATNVILCVLVLLGFADEFGFADLTVVGQIVLDVDMENGRLK